MNTKDQSERYTKEDLSSDQLEKYIKEDKDIKDKYIISILRAYDLIKELVHVVK